MPQRPRQDDRSPLTDHQSPITNHRHWSLLVNVPTAVGECFTYASTIAVAVGDRVEVELGRRREIAFVVGPAEARAGAKPIIRRCDPLPLLSGSMLELTRWLARRWCVSWYRAVETALPAAVKRRDRSGAKTRRALSVTLTPVQLDEKLAGDERLLSACRMVLEHPDVLSVADLARRFELTRGRVETLIRRGWIKVRETAERRDPFAGAGAASRDAPLPLTSEQAAALEKILSPDSPRETLLAGITGSGKTEVYLQAIARLLTEGRGAIVLVPEISLTPQTVDRFRRRFGETVAILHSRLSAGERHDEWVRLRRGEARVAVGARSAVFAPIAPLGLIAIDEAHESSYKQGESPRYHAVEVARERARLEGALLVLGTATPTLELQERAPTVIALTRRIASRPLPTVEVADMREELARGNRHVFSAALDRAVKAALGRNEQAILFLNRRGHAAFVLCRSCGQAVRCPSCAVSLTEHHAARARLGGALLVCHLCDHRAPTPTSCPACGSRAIRSFGAGTERIEAEAKARYAGARVLRMDADTTVRKGSHRDLLAAFAAGDYDLLVGTQMIGKGLDLPKVTVVGVVAADVSLFMPDFRAAERTFSLLVQVIGRAGRAERPGLAIIQTYNPGHHAIRAAATQDVTAFLAAERERRRAAGQPPFSRLVQWTLEGPHDETVRAAAVEARARLEGRPGQLLGPAPAPLERLRGRWRWQVRWFAPPDTDDATIAATAAQLEKLKSKLVRVLPDVDPVDLQ